MSRSFQRLTVAVLVVLLLSATRAQDRTVFVAVPNGSEYHSNGRCPRIGRATTLELSLASLKEGIRPCPLCARPDGTVPGSVLLRQLLSPEEFSRAGLSRLTAEELGNLEAALRPHLSASRAGARATAPSIPAGARAYELEVSHNDELFVVNGERFEAKTYCFNMAKGDRIQFLDGSPFGACASAKLLNLRTRQVCEVWCE